MKRKVTAIIILIAAGILASFLAFSFNDNGEKLGIFTETRGSDNSRFNFLRQTNPQQLTTAQDKTNNLTDSLTQEYLEEIIKINPDGPQLMGDIPQLTVPGEETFQSILLNYFNKSLEWENLTEEDIKVASKETAQDTLEYLEIMKEILDDKTKLIEEEAIALAESLERNNQNPLQKVIGKLHIQLRKVLVITAPLSYKKFHIQTANFLQKQIAIYDAVLKTIEDPVKALLAINEIPDAGRELENLRTFVE